MHFTIIGGGPGGLYFAYLMKHSFPKYHIRVVEQNAANVTFGFGVVLSSRALDIVAQGTDALVARLRTHMESWSDQHIVLRGERVVVDGSSFTAVERLLLLSELQQLCVQTGVEIQFGMRVDGPDVYLESDVLVGADGANSVIRGKSSEQFGTSEVDLQNHFAWYGARLPYPAHTISFETSAGGVFCGHHYRYKPAMSTFVAEVDAETWQRSGMVSMDDEQRRGLIEKTFARTLSALPLVSNRSTWRRWRLVKNERWFHGRTVLIGDALRTAHPSIGSGTRLAMEDAVALWRAFQIEGTSITAAFERFVSERRPVREKLDLAADLSIGWYERMADKVRLKPYELALDYLTRTNVMTTERLARESPVFWRNFNQQMATPSA